MDQELIDPDSPKVRWANQVAHSIMLAYGLTDRTQWRSRRAFFDKLAAKLMTLHDQGVPPHDLPKLIRGEIPWPR